MDNSILLRNGMLLSDPLCDACDLRIVNGSIQEIGAHLPLSGSRAVDISGLHIAPGFVDLHVHLREPGFSYKETIASGTRAAAAGGYTTVCAMPNVLPTPDCIESLLLQKQLITENACIEVLPLGTLTVGESGQALSDIRALAPYCHGFSDDGKGVQSETLMRSAMEAVADAQRTLFAHCEENALLTPGGCVHQGIAAAIYHVPGIASDTEYQQVARDIALVRKTGVRYHVCHVSAKESVQLIREAKAEGLPVTCECTPHQLLLCDEDIIADDGRYKMNPPLRTRSDRDAIRTGLLDGTIDCIATDHAPHSAEEKSRGLLGSAFGVVGLETAFSVCYTELVQKGLCTASLLMEKMVYAPTRILGRPLPLRVGSPASFTLIDLAKRYVIRGDAFQSLGKHTPFEGKEVSGQIVSTWYRGQEIYTA